MSKTNKFGKFFTRSIDNKDLTLSDLSTLIKYTQESELKKEYKRKQTTKETSN